MLTKEGYKIRLIDNELSKLLKVFGAVSLEGPKWCGKTWTALNHANSAVFLNNSENNFQERRYAEMDVSLILGREAPELIDEWQDVPAIWDAVRYQCDQDSVTGKYILTGSATPVNDSIRHSGAGRICRINMRTMSLYELGDSSGQVSLQTLFDGKVKNSTVPEKSIDEIANYIIRGGWPANQMNSRENAGLIPKSYLQDVLLHDISSIDGVMRDQRKMEMLIRSLARNKSSLASNTTLVRDITETEGDGLAPSKNVIAEYLDVLRRLHILDDQLPYGANVRSPERVGKSVKHHFADVSLAAAALGLTTEKLLDDLNTFGLLFEGLCIHDLMVYMEVLGGKVFHYRDNSSGLEVDAIVELSDGSYGAIEIKLGTNTDDEAATNLLKFSEQMTTPPKFMAIINGLGGAIVRRPDRIYSLPITCLKP